MRTYASSWVKRKSFLEKVNSRRFCWFPAAILVDQNGTPICGVSIKLYKGAWNVLANNSETLGRKDLKLGQIVYISVFYNISFSWLLPLDGFQFIFLLRDGENDLYYLMQCTSILSGTKINLLMLVSFFICSNQSFLSLFWQSGYSSAIWYLCLC